MKKTILLTFVIFLVCTLFLVGSVFAQQGGSGNGSNGQGNSSGNQIMNQSGEMNQNQNQVIAGNATQLHQMIQQRQQEMEQEMNNLNNAGEQNVLQNQNRIRLAVYTMLAMENLTGGIGKNISEIAKEFNNSVQATIRAEERIEKRSGFSRLFAGGDEKAGKEIEQEVERSRNRLQELNQLKEQCSCDAEVKAVLQEQIQNMEMEQNRLETKAQNEMKSKGMFGWLWK